MPSSTVIADLRDKPVFILLGELGVGKSWLFENEAQRLRQTRPRCISRFVRLGEYGDTAELERDVFTESELRSAIGSGRLAYLFLDALDQGLIQMPSLAHFLERWAKKLQSKSVRLRVSSRMSLQALNLGSNLAEVYSTEPNQLMFRIGVLTPDDVLNEASSRGIDGPRFVKAVRSRNAEVLATHPLSLDLLLETYAHAGTLTGDLTELYRRACRRLSEEHELAQAATALVRGPRAYAITGRLAAVSALSGSSLISIAPQSDRPQNSIGIEDATHSLELSDQGSFVIADRDVQYILGNAHFQSAGEGNYRWVHLGLQDFMAAEWIKNRLRVEQIRGLLVHPLDPRGQIRPELEEIAAWLAGMIPEVRDYLMRFQPIVLLTSQAHLGALADPAALLAALLTPDNARRVRWFQVPYWHLRRLRSDQAKGLLRPHLRTTGVDQDVQWFALAVIRELRLGGFDDELVRLATSESVAQFVAVSAGLALEEFGGATARRRIGDRLRRSDAGSLPDEIKAALIRAAWPKHVSAETLFRVFSPPADQVIGLYDVLPADLILAGLTLRDIPAALHWVASEPERGYSPPNRQSLVEGIIQLAAQHLAKPEVRTAMRQLLVARFSTSIPPSGSSDIFSPLYSSPAEARSLFVDAVNSLADPQLMVQAAFWRAGRFIGSLSWQLTQLKMVRGEPQERAWLWLIERTPTRTKTEIARLKSLAPRYPELAAIIADKTQLPKRAAMGLSRHRRLAGAPDPNQMDLSPVQRLELALTHSATNAQARLDASDLVWQLVSTSNGTTPLWETLSPNLKARVNEFFEEQLSLPALD